MFLLIISINIFLVHFFCVKLCRSSSRTFITPEIMYKPRSTFEFRALEFLNAKKIFKFSMESSKLLLFGSLLSAIVHFWISNKKFWPRSSKKTSGALSTRLRWYLVVSSRCRTKSSTFLRPHSALLEFFDHSVLSLLLYMVAVVIIIVVKTTIIINILKLFVTISFVYYADQTFRWSLFVSAVLSVFSTSRSILILFNVNVRNNVLFCILKASCAASALVKARLFWLILSNLTNHFSCQQEQLHTDNTIFIHN